MKHLCELCNYSNDRLENYIKHMKTDKHKLKMEIIRKEEVNNKNLLIVADKITKLEDTIVKEVKKEVKKVKNNTDKNNKIITKQIEEVKNIATQNREYAKSTLTILNEFYKDNPPLEYPGDRECLTLLQTYYISLCYVYYFTHVTRASHSLHCYGVIVFLVLRQPSPINLLRHRL